MRDLGGSPVEIVAGVMRDQCAALFEEWRQRGERRTY